MVRDGLGVLGVGLVLFLAGFAFFEGVLHIGGEHGIAPLGRQALPTALIAAGVVLIITRLWPRRRDEWPADQVGGQTRSAPQSLAASRGDPSPPPEAE